MLRLTTSSMLAAIVAATGIGVMAHSANADTPDPTVTFSLVSGTAGTTQYTLTNATPGTGPSSVTTASGPYNCTINQSAVLAYCVDFTHDINFAGSGAPGSNTFIADDFHNLRDPAAGTNTADLYYHGGLASALVGAPSTPDPTGKTTGEYDATGISGPSPTLSAALRSNAISILAQNMYVASGVDQAAVSLAIWDIVQDGYAGGITSNGGVGTIDTDAFALENSAISQAVSGTFFTNVLWVQAPNNKTTGGLFQDFITLTTNPTRPGNPGVPQGTVPEPGIFVTSFSLLGMVGTGLVKGRRRQGARKTAA